MIFILLGKWQDVQDLAARNSREVNSVKQARVAGLVEQCRRPLWLETGVGSDRGRVPDLSLPICVRTTVRTQ